ncbi:TrkH family potassium uptake protein [Salinibacter ruber]|jgi:trk system potassium uptake protein TrkH|uniref:Trk system potassium uptake protein TrkH n=2 Tax=Salinibacter ruber TaxID=146919 RepID=A0A9X2ZA36_9BACT|nr:TrkH family potassium uptake protein [Salinibacter ruber]MCS3612402.1 trk system potassium uptake protein TrkH [Salinibacter ruber]MCS3614330.1 trk system potassium uptake protein TrkH [Salinibacter ruber]MCS3637569.1 trk system potassium uptake protein TrkH [Salinibacter ruber]MCS3668426.1 trk system potassium uptake protein TrkH [Salinibacter ruber]MCS3673012.1 trk system potassium uptake protein TrkH [Salinibacter ruber]
MIAARRLRRVSSVLGPVLKWFSAVFSVPIATALYHGTSVVPFLVPLGLSFGAGALAEWIGGDSELTVQDGFLLVTLTWVLVSLLGSVPYLLSGTGSFATPINAVFESFSGFSATGSTILLDISIEKHGAALMLWRQLTQWIAGMGILALAVAVLPRLSAGGAQFLDAEVPGPRLERLTPHIAETARRLWLLYIGCSVVLLVLLLGVHYAGLAPRMTPYQALAHVFTTIPSGGFSPQARSIEAFAPAVQWILVPFMFVAAMNFTLLWQAIVSTPTAPARDTEFRVYLSVFVVGSLLVSAMLWGNGQFAGLEDTLRHGTFQTATLLTTTGYASTDFAVWSEEVLVVLLLLMFASGCVGSTSGGLKLMRWTVGFKVIGRELFQMIHPSSVRPMWLGRRTVKEPVVRGILIVILTYLLLVVGGTGFIAVDAHRVGIDLSISEALSGTLVVLGNIGPGFGAVGPMGGFEALPVPTKVFMCLLMVAGRLEVMTFLVVLSPSYWRG